MLQNGLGDLNNGGLQTTAAVLALIRSGTASTRPELVRQSHLARNVVSDRVERLLELGVIREHGLGPSTGGRAPRSLGFAKDAGHILVAELGATTLGLGIADLAGDIVRSREMTIDVTDGPVATLETVHHELNVLLREQPVEVWAMAIGLPGPVEWESGRPYAPPIMPGWDGFDVRGYLSARFNCPVWVDNDVNMMAVGEMRAGVARGHANAMYVKVGTGIGAGLYSQGLLHRGAQGAAGDVGHISVAPDSDILCRCGNRGCLEAIAGGAFLIRSLPEAQNDPSSTHLASMCDRHGSTIEALVAAARFGDPVALGLLSGSARTVGGVLAQMVNLLNPSIIVLGGRVGRALDMYLSTLRQSILERSLPLATRSLEVVISPLGDDAGLVGAAFTAVDELLSPDGLARRFA